MVGFDELLDLLATGYNKFLFDNFRSTESIDVTPTGTGSVTTNLFELLLSTGIVSGGVGKAYYNTCDFNPFYATAILRFHLRAMKDLFAFIGFKGTTADPAWDMTESHSGIMVKDSGVYFSTANELGVNATQQRTPIPDIDMTRDLIYKIVKNRFYTLPISQVVPYFDTFRPESFPRADDRKWTLRATNATSPPEDKVHYMVFYITNTINANQWVKFKAFTYGEEYAD